MGSADRTRPARPAEPAYAIRPTDHRYYEYPFFFRRRGCVIPVVYLHQTGLRKIGRMK